jgi:hypothetical protein
MTTTKTKAGWMVEITNMRGGCLEVGGVCAKHVLYKRATLAALGIGYNSDPDAYERGTDNCSTNVAALVALAAPDQIIRAGQRIE